MKINALRILTVVAILASAYSFGQNLQPKKTPPAPLQISYQGSEGVFITYGFMDMNAEKLLDRKGLLIENMTLGEIAKTLQARAQVLEEKNELIFINFQTSEALRLKAEAQISLLNASLANQIQITTNNKRKARRNGLLLFGGGVTVGVIGLALLL
tara:strand:- start:1750 stop:2217 length:468 start_codon:yes stop_codon:yes gene_type:complete